MKVGLNTSNLYNNSPRVISNNSEENHNAKGLSNNSNPSFGLISSNPVKMFGVPLLVILLGIGAIFRISNNDKMMKSLDKFIEGNGGGSSSQIKGIFAKQRELLVDGVKAGGIQGQKCIKGISKGDYLKGLRDFLTKTKIKKH